MKVISIINHKGGVGKSTFATNICSYYANKGKRVVLGDFDPQQSSYNWLMIRPNKYPHIDILEFENGIPQKPEGNIDFLILDTQAGVVCDRLKNLIFMSDKIITPVKPGLFDITATRTFLEEVKPLIEYTSTLRATPIDICLVGNMVEGRSSSGQQLINFIKDSNIYNPLLLRQSQLYVQFAAYGAGIFDIEHPQLAGDKNAWQPLFNWIDSNPTQNLTTQEQDNLIDKISIDISQNKE